MIERYTDGKIVEIWSDSHKLSLWQKTELAVIEAMANLGRIERGVYSRIREALDGNPIDIEWWKQRDQEIHHDLNAFLDERARFLGADLEQYWHQGLTSYDTEEPAFARMLRSSLHRVEAHYGNLVEALKEKAWQYRYVIMIGRTHGQAAQLQSAGKRFLCWLQDLAVDEVSLLKAGRNLKYSKLSGAIGNYGGLDPDLEKEALRVLGFEPFYGATQIMPREMCAPLAQVLCQLVCTLDKIAVAIRLGARSPHPIYQEPFGQKHKGSSVMPQKKNPIRSEQVEGMANMAKAYLRMIMDNIRTWEERAIEQSCVERVAWPDLFHIVVHVLKRMEKVLQGLVIYPDNMLWEIHESRGCYASSEAKEFLKREGVEYGLSAEDAYRIVQLAAFIAFEPGDRLRDLRTDLPISLVEADHLLLAFPQMPKSPDVSLCYIIREGLLSISEELAATEEEIKRWVEILEKIFTEQEKRDDWNRLFLPSYLLRNEEKLYQEILSL